LADEIVACHVCGEMLVIDLTYCNRCDRPFHLRQREGSEEQDCGEVWINEQYLALEYACDVCLGKGAADGGGEPPVASGH
jgi:hypothetical protein